MITTFFLILSKKYLMIDLQTIFQSEGLEKFTNVERTMFPLFSGSFDLIQIRV